MTYAIIALVGLVLAFALLRNASANALIADNGPPAGEETGPLEVYFNKMRDHEAGGYTEYFVTASVQGSDHFVQVSASLGSDGWGYMYDLPLFPWSESYEQPIVAEAKRRGLAPVIEPKSRLYITFDDFDAHADFTRWIVAEVFNCSESTKFDINWG